MELLPGAEQLHVKYRCYGQWPNYMDKNVRTGTCAL